MSDRHVLHIDHRPSHLPDRHASRAEWRAFFTAMGFRGPLPRPMPAPVRAISRAIATPALMDRNILTRIVAVGSVLAIAFAAGAAMLTFLVPMARHGAMLHHNGWSIGPFGGVTFRGALILLLFAALFIGTRLVLNGLTGRIGASDASSHDSARLSDAMQTLAHIDFVAVAGDTQVINAPGLQRMARLETWASQVVEGIDQLTIDDAPLAGIPGGGGLPLGRPHRHRASAPCRDGRIRSTARGTGRARAGLRRRLDTAGRSATGHSRDPGGALEALAPAAAAPVATIPQRHAEGRRSPGWQTQNCATTRAPLH